MADHHVMRIIRALACLAVALTAGCADLQKVAPDDKVVFELAGRIAMRYRDEAASGNLVWRHARESDELLLTTPIGNSLARVVRSGDAVTLTTANGEEHRAGDAETLTARVLGFPLPLAGLADWVRGRPVDGPAVESARNPQGRIETLRQSGWTIEYHDYNAEGLPSRMKLTFPGIELRLAIHQWTTPDSHPAAGTARR